jgi:hypothetical protein
VSFETVTTPVQPPLDAIAATIQAMFHPLTATMQAPGPALVAIGRGAPRTSVEAVLDSLAASVQPPIDTLTAAIEAPVHAIPPVFEAVLHPLTGPGLIGSGTHRSGHHPHGQHRAGHHGPPCKTATVFHRQRPSDRIERLSSLDNAPAGRRLTWIHWRSGRFPTDYRVMHKRCNLSTIDIACPTAMPWIHMKISNRLFCIHIREPHQGQSGSASNRKTRGSTGSSRFIHKVIHKLYG